MFEFESIEFTTQATMNREKARLVDELCLFLDIPRDGFRLQQGNIHLLGLSDDGAWLSITNHIGDFAGHLKSKAFKSYKLVSKLQVK